jgi:hypothetical protein
MRWDGLDRSTSGWVNVESFCERGNEFLCFLKCRETIEWLNNWWSLEETSSPQSLLVSYLVHNLTKDGIPVHSPGSPVLPDNSVFQRRRLLGCVAARGIYKKCGCIAGCVSFS